MSALYFIASYLLAFVPILAAWICFGTFLAACRLLIACFGRPRASEPCFQNAVLSVAAGAAAIYGIKGIYWLAAVVDYTPTASIVLMFVWPGFAFRQIVPALWQEAGLNADGRRFNWLRKVDESDAAVKNDWRKWKDDLRNALTGSKK